MKYKFKYECIGWYPSDEDNSQCDHLMSDKTCRFFINHKCDDIEEEKDEKKTD